VSLVASLAALTSIAIAYGRWIEKLNGMGKRVEILEVAKQRNDGAEIERVRVIDRVLNQHEDLIRQITEAKSIATDARHDGEENSDRVSQALATLERSINGMRLDLSQRLTAVETKLDMRTDE
jgi:hypothetical protein